ncbi:hypothetical protein BX600DRAFT_508495 [Xylariales sp. PMI_506]|nr:hypothetical protein BX600DRAFT_508495 [Xylariales sp. PMI_506]
MYYNNLYDGVHLACPSGTAFYHCNAYNYSGCCKKDACDPEYAGCTNIDGNNPDQTNSSSDGTATTTIRSTRSVGDPVTAPTPTTSASTTASPSSAVTTSQVTVNGNSNTASADISASSGGPDVLTTTPVPTKTSVGNSTDATQAGTSLNLGQGAIAGISIGASIAFLGVIFLMFLLIRRRWISNRVISYQHHEYRDDDDRDTKNVIHGGDIPFTSITACNSTNDRQLPAIDSFPTSSGQWQELPTEKNAAWPFSRASNPISPISAQIISPISPLSTAQATFDESIGDSKGNYANGSEEPAQLDSRPVYFELDSTMTTIDQPDGAISPVALTPRLGQSYELTPKEHAVHPKSLTPGLPGAVLSNATKQSLTRVRVGEAAVVSVSTTQHRSHDSYDHPTRTSATLNATAEDIQRNRHVNSWTHL